MTYVLAPHVKLGRSVSSVSQQPRDMRTGRWVDAPGAMGSRSHEPSSTTVNRSGQVVGLQPGALGNGAGSVPATPQKIHAEMRKLGNAPSKPSGTVGNSNQRSFSEGFTVKREYNGDVRVSFQSATKMGREYPHERDRVNNRALAARAHLESKGFGVTQPSPRTLIVKGKPVTPNKAQIAAQRRANAGNMWS